MGLPLGTVSQSSAKMTVKVAPWWEKKAFPRSAKAWNRRRVQVSFKSIQQHLLSFYNTQNHTVGTVRDVSLRFNLHFFFFFCDFANLLNHQLHAHKKK